MPRLVCVVLAVLVGCAGAAEAQLPLSASTYRVFLKDGRTLASYGDVARVGDRLIFNLPLLAEAAPVAGAAGRPAPPPAQAMPARLTLQLVSLPVGLIDLERTARYAHTMRATHYAATRGEADFAALTEDVTRNLGLLTSVDDRQRQLTMAEDLRQRVQEWPRDHFHYRAADVQELVALFSDVINELRIAAGAGVSLDLSSGPIEPPREVLLGVLSPRESVELALAAADTADIGDERLAILRAALETLADGTSPLRDAVGRRLEQEVRVGVSYTALTAEFRRRADAAVKAGNEGAVDQLAAELLKRDQQLGFRRPADIAALVTELEGKRDLARARRTTLARRTASRQGYLTYERSVRPAFSGLDGLTPILEHIRDGKPFAFERLLTAKGRLDWFDELARNVQPPGDLTGIHATLISAISMAREACARRQTAVVTTKTQVNQEASSAAAGALLLIAHARRDLVEVLQPLRPE